MARSFSLCLCALVVCSMCSIVAGSNASIPVTAIVGVHSTRAPSSTMTPSSTFAMVDPDDCTEITISDTMHDNYFLNDNNPVPLFKSWLYRWSSTQTFIYSDSYDTESILYYLPQSGWVLEVLDTKNSLRNRIIYQSFIESELLPVGQLHEWTSYRDEYSTLALQIECSSTATGVLEATSIHSTQRASAELEETGQHDETVANVSNTINQIYVILIAVVAALICLLVLVPSFLYYIVRAQKKPRQYTLRCDSIKSVNDTYYECEQHDAEIDEKECEQHDIRNMVTSSPHARRVMSTPLPWDGLQESLKRQTNAEQTDDDLVEPSVNDVSIIIKHPVFMD